MNQEESKVTYTVASVRILVRMKLLGELPVRLRILSFLAVKSCQIDIKI